MDKKLIILLIVALLCCLGAQGKEKVTPSEQISLKIGDLTIKDSKWTTVIKGDTVTINDPKRLTSGMPLTSYQVITIQFDEQLQQWIITKFDCQC